jgi:hypothetical protein
MTDVLIYWRDYRKNAERPTWQWHTNARRLADLQPGKGGGVKIIKGERRLNKVRINIMSMSWDQWNDIYNEVIDPLAKEGADIHWQVIVIAQGDAAIRENTVKRGIKAEIQTG